MSVEVYCGEREIRKSRCCYLEIFYLNTLVYQHVI